MTIYFIGKKVKTRIPEELQKSSKKVINKKLIGAERFDHSKITGSIIGRIIICFVHLFSYTHPNTLSFQFITPNFLNLSLLALALISHGSITNFLTASESAIGGTVGILSTVSSVFWYNGHLSINRNNTRSFSFFQHISSELTYPIYTFFSAGLINFFVPSGGGQWYIQGPLIIQSALEMGIPLHKSIMALAYGDQITNMMQPFWAFTSSWA